jgi:hypothetical protein
LDRPAIIGRDDWIRTSDPLTPSQVRYQAALHPVSRSVRPKPDTTSIGEPDTTSVCYRFLFTIAGAGALLFGFGFGFGASSTRN